ncbi:MAG: monovalent cation/H+ antiporter subunit D [Alkalimonas sp.]|nr:monovalent cation/H+ antiporter subunit D [Alkalimonas sp.]
MMHLMILPVLIPLFAGALLTLLYGLSMRQQRALSLLSTLGQLLVALLLMQQALSGDYFFYQLGNWQPPFGIVLVLDQLSAMMLLLLAGLALFSTLYACVGDDRKGAHFHALIQFQLLGLNGAVLTGDLFNLFVFFEILLIASYALLLHGGGRERSRAGLRYVIMNLVGSAFFLIALGVLYGVTGTLNMADMALKIQQLPAADRPLIHAAAALLLVVFGIKGALLPLLFWLPRAYAAAAAPVAALFAVMTKIGIYAMIRVFYLVFGGEDGIHLSLWQWLWPLALATMAIGAIGALGARSLRGLTAWMVIVSVGTLMAAIAEATIPALAAALLYLCHSTLLTATFFLLADVVQRYRPGPRDYFVTGARVRHPVLLGALFFTAAVAFAGLPPLSGFISKVWLLSSVTSFWGYAVFWPMLLASSLVIIVALSRAGSALLWRQNKQEPLQAKAPASATSIVICLLTLSVLFSVLAQPLMTFATSTATQILSTERYLHAIPLGEGL